MNCGQVEHLIKRKGRGPEAQGKSVLGPIRNQTNLKIRERGKNVERIIHEKYIGK